MAAVIADSAKQKRCTYPSQVGTGRDPFESAAISQHRASDGDQCALGGEGLHVESELDNIAVGHHIVLAFQPNSSPAAGSLQ